MLGKASKAFTRYFPSLDIKQYDWVSSPFGDYESTDLTTEEEEQLIDLKNDRVHKSTFEKKDNAEFWISLQTEYPELCLKAVKILLPFASSYICEFGFSALTEIKSKKRERLQTVHEEMCVALSTIEPRIELICSQKQAHPSH